MDGDPARRVQGPAASRPPCRIATQFLDHAEAAALAWSVAVLAVLVVQMATSLLRGEVGLDLVVLLSMVGTLALSQPLAGAVIAQMVAGGQSLEGFEAKRADRAMAALVARQPRIALLVGQGDGEAGGGAKSRSRSRHRARITHPPYPRSYDGEVLDPLDVGPGPRAALDRPCYSGKALRLGGASPAGPKGQAGWCRVRTTQPIRNAVRVHHGR
ncbi:hypothetical protein ACQVP2_13140 [Methylobacterium aquaticum]|uniref:hypothetical protein n=1 Tax=Methylobacterium aquaticum TaxID=270351 RepID=UPI003D166B77